MSDLKQLEDRILRLEQHMNLIRRARKGLIVEPALNILGQNTRIDGDLSVSNDLSVDGNVSVVGNVDAGDLLINSDSLEDLFAPIAHVGAGGAAHADVTTSADGFMTAADKTKLDGITALATRFVPLTTPLTSTSWDGDSFSTTAKTVIDLSAVFGVPAGVKAVDIKIMLRDSGSASYAALIILGPDNTSYRGKAFQCGGLPSNYIDRSSAIVSCDANGDIYYQIDASGSGTMDVWLEIWGYWI